jgi:hypothetical protein
MLLGQSMSFAELHFEPLLREAAVRLRNGGDGGCTSSIVQGAVDSGQADLLESLVEAIAMEFRLQGSLHLHSHSYSVRFSLPHRDAAA